MVRAVRGATTIESNDAPAIIKGTSELLKEMVDKNDISIEDIISVIFTATGDLDAVFPAVAARQLGWDRIALMDMKEIEVPGSLAKCIRVLMHLNTEKTNDELRYVYLNGAAVLRPDLHKT